MMNFHPEADTLTITHAERAKKKVIVTSLVLAAILSGLWYGYFRLRPSPPPIAEYSINGTVSEVEAAEKRIVLRLPVVSATAAGTSIGYEDKLIAVSDSTIFTRSHILGGKLAFAPAGFPEVSRGAQIIVYTSVNPNNTELIPAHRVEIVE